MSLKLSYLDSKINFLEVLKSRNNISFDQIKKLQQDLEKLATNPDGNKNLIENKMIEME